MSNGSKTSIKVGFLSQQNTGWMGGINYYKNLFVAMSKVDNPKIIPYILPQSDEKAKILYKYAETISPLQKGIKYRLAKIKAILARKKFNKEKFLYQNLDLDIISHAQIPTINSSIAWISDFQHVNLPEMFKPEEITERNNSFKYLADHNKIVLLSSHDALEDFKKFSPENAHKGRVLHFVAIPEENIYEKTDAIKDATIKKFNLPERYFYVPNQFWKHKNHKVVFEAISVLKKLGIDIKVVFTGNTTDYRNENYFVDLMEYARQENIENNIILLGLIDLIEVQFLLRNCISIINPSFFEGWSSTVEEAKSIGKNIILSNINVHKEQNPPEGIYFNPTNAQELAEILKNKWASGKFGPDLELEKQAKENLEKRIIEFGKTYQEIILEAIAI